MTSLSSADRFFRNTTISLEDCQLLSKEACLERAIDLLSQCWEHYKTSESGTLYCGSLGPCCYLRLVLSSLLPSEQQVLRDVERIARQTLTTQNDRDVTTLLLSPTLGALAVLAATQHRRGDAEGALATAQQVVDGLKQARLPPKECEILYGRAGSIGCVLFLRQHLANPSIGQDLVVTLATEILQQGRSEAALHPHHQLPLLWCWCGNHYLGAAHGVVGILQTLLSLPSAELDLLQKRLQWDVKSVLRATVDALDQFCDPTTGNLQSSIDSEKDRLVHWCHGAPGHVMLLVKAYEVFGNTRYMEKARALARDVVWSRGLLKKGVGLCHGISGNAFVFLALARVDEEGRSDWIAMAHAFARFSLEHLSDLKDIPDTPYSLFEGIGGLAALLLNLAGTDLPLGGFPLYEFHT